PDVGPAFVHRQDEQQDEDDQDERAQRLELPIQVRRGALLDRPGDVLHPGRALIGTHDLVVEEVSEHERTGGDRGDDYYDEVVRARDLRGLRQRKREQCVLLLDDDGEQPQDAGRRVELVVRGCADRIPAVVRRSRGVYVSVASAPGRAWTWEPDHRTWVIH